MKRQNKHITIIGLLCMTFILSSCKSDQKSNQSITQSDNLPTELIDTLQNTAQEVQQKKIDSTKVNDINNNYKKVIQTTTNKNVDENGTHVSSKTINALLDTLKSIGQEVQQKLIDPTSDNVIYGKNGTVIYIAANSLLDEKGKLISTKTIIELTEHYTIADYISSNLQTVHNTEILQTQGMVYLSAKTTDGAIIKIDKSKPIRIEFPIKERIEGTKIFTGRRDENGNLNWSEINEPSKYLVVYPIRFVSQNKGPTDCGNYYGITTDTLNKTWTYNYYGEVEEFENTFLATREFKERYVAACFLDIPKVYIANIDKNLWEVDELMIEQFIKDSTKEVDYYVNLMLSGVIAYTTEEDKKSYDRNLTIKKNYWNKTITRFKNFAGQKLTKIDPTKRIGDTILTEINKVSIAYDALEFGWVNVDYFYNDPNSVDIRLIAKTNEVAPVINLIIPNRNVILSGILKDDYTYYFTKNVDGFNKLPKGEKAFIVAFSIVNNTLYFAEKEIVIGQSETETLELRKTTSETIKSGMKKYGS